MFRKTRIGENMVKIAIYPPNSLILADLLERKLQLPIEYLSLIEEFNSLEKEIDLSQEQQIKLENKNENVIKQILKVWPECYIVDYIHNIIKKPFDVCCSIEERERQLKDKLIEIVKIHHDKFIKTLGICFPSPFVVGTWHSLFDVETCPSL